ncbi:MAG: hypothetical protein JKY96_01550 [Phycisphaerales bacterium]|nr:hypothetical protein [Phycisphaerales bacterium]
MLMLFGLLIGAAIQGVIVGLITMLASKVVVNEAPEFGDAFKACFYAALVNAGVQIVLGFVMPDSTYAILGISLVASYAVYVILFQTIIGYTLGQAAAVAAVATAFMLALIIGFGILLAALGTGAVVAG